METTAFTAQYNGIARVLISKVAIADPIKSRLNDEIPKPVEFESIWDTGATGTVITKKVVNALELIPTGGVEVSTANGKCYVNTYVIDLWLPNKICIQGLTVTEGNFSSADLLIGMDVINQGDFAVSNYKGKTTFSFRWPSIEETDYVKIINDNKVKGIGRNDKCHCGSGKKFKNCHGR